MNIKNVFSVTIVILTFFINGFCQTNSEILVFSKTNSYRHASITDGINALSKMAIEESWTITFTEDSIYFNEANLKSKDLIIFLNTTGDILGDNEKVAFENYIKNGGGFLGIHAASDTEFEWPFYAEMIGAQFLNHPKIQDAKLNVHLEETHKSIQHLDSIWMRKDEWYNFRKAPSDHLNVLIDLDEKTITGKIMNSYHPISWYQVYHGAKIFYTAMGHTPESYSDEHFLLHVKGGIEWILSD